MTQRYPYQGEQLTVAEIAARKGCSPNALRQRIARYGVERGLYEAPMSKAEAGRKGARKQRRDPSHPYYAWKING